MSPAAQSVISFRASVSPPLVTCPQHPSPETLDRTTCQITCPGPQVPARSLPPCPLARSAAGACESADLSGYQCRAERRKNSCSWATAPARLDQSLPMFLVSPARKASFAFSNPCQTPAHLFQVSAHVPASSPQSLRSPPPHHSEILLTSSTFP